MPSLPTAGSLVGWIKLWCERPGLYLVGAPDYRTPNVGALFHLIIGYETALEVLGREPEYPAFKEWIYLRRPDLRERSLWFGGQLLRERADGDQGMVIAQIGEWAAEYERSKNGTRKH